MKIKKTYKGGFTLIELLVVILIISALASISYFSLLQVRKKNRDAKRKADLTAISNALQLYFQQNGKYPNSSGTTQNEMIQCNTATDTTVISWGSRFVCDGVVYMDRLPIDPLYPTKTYRYCIYAPGVTGLDNTQCLSSGVTPSTFYLLYLPEQALQTPICVKVVNVNWRWCSHF